MEIWPSKHVVTANSVNIQRFYHEILNVMPHNTKLVPTNNINYLVHKGLGPSHSNYSTIMYYTNCIKNIYDCPQTTWSIFYQACMVGKNKYVSLNVSLFDICNDIPHKGKDAQELLARLNVLHDNRVWEMRQVIHIYYASSIRSILAMVT